MSFEVHARMSFPGWMAAARVSAAQTSNANRVCGVCASSLRRRCRRQRRAFQRTTTVTLIDRDGKHCLSPIITLYYYSYANAGACTTCKYLHECVCVFEPTADTRFRVAHLHVIYARSECVSTDLSLVSGAQCAMMFCWGSSEGN